MGRADAQSKGAGGPRRGQSGGGRGRSDPGPRGERIAERCLRKRGYRLLARSLALRPGEIDLLMETPDRSAVVVVEVKTREHAPTSPPRSGRNAGGDSGVNAVGDSGGGADPFAPELRVGPAKQRKLEQLGAALLRDPRAAGRSIRFDVVAVELNDPPRRQAGLRTAPPPHPGASAVSEAQRPRMRLSSRLPRALLLALEALGLNPRVRVRHYPDAFRSQR
ncbi:MAG: YraN family protein [Planctomycetota bacterium]